MGDTFLKIKPDGTLEIFDDDINLINDYLTIVKKKRLARVEPANFLLRILFHSFRILSFFNPIIIAWTRTWKCKWRLKIIKTFKTRDDAISAEHDIVRYLYF